MRSLPVVLLLGWVLSQAPSALAARSVDALAHALFRDSYALVDPDLRQLADFGEPRAYRLLADRQVSAGRMASREPLEAYRQAFDSGRGDLEALAAMARALAHTPYWQSRYRDFFAAALTRFRSMQDVPSLQTALEVFLVFPDLFAPETAAQLIQAYQSSCLDNCVTHLYLAVLAEYQGDRQQAENHYQQALVVQGRAVDYYVRFLGDAATSRFPEVAESLVPYRAELSAEVLLRIGTQLDRIADLAELQERYLQRSPGQAAAVVVADSEQLYRQSQAWIDLAVARDYLPALVVRFNQMTSQPARYTAVEATQLVNRIALQDQGQAVRLLIHQLMIINWSSLDPQRAHQLIQALLEEGHEDAWSLLAELYSRGGLDEPDQQAALAIYQRLAEAGYTTAWHRQATIYLAGHAICRDYTLGYAYAQLAADLGVARANTTLLRATHLLSAEEIEQAQHIYQELLQEALP